jgi:hypothetical protein
MKKLLLLIFISVLLSQTRSQDQKSDQATSTKKLFIAEHSYMGPFYEAINHCYLGYCPRND